MIRCVLIVVLILFSVNSSIAMEEKKNILKSKPYFTILIKSSNIAFLAFVNGNPVLTHFSDQNVDTELPINHWMSPDQNEIEVIVWSTNAEKGDLSNSNLEMELRVQDESLLRELPIKLADLVFDGELHQLDPNGNAISRSMGVINLDSTNNFKESTGGDVKLKKVFFERFNNEKNTYSLRRTVNVPNNLPRWAFFDSDEIPAIDESSMSEVKFERFRHSLFVEYLKVFNAIKNKKIDLIIPMYAERNGEYDAALYYIPGTMEKKIKAALEGAANDPDTELLDFKEEDLSFEIFDNNKLVRLVRADESKAIVQNFKKAQGSQSFDLIFRYKNGKWILTR